MPRSSRFYGKSRSQKRADNNLGIILVGKAPPKCRTPELERLDKYLNDTQYDGLVNWEEAEACGPNDYIPIRKRKPRIIYPYAKIMRNRISAKLLGKSVFPKLVIEDSEDDQDFLNVVVKQTLFKSRMLQASKMFSSHGTVFVRFKLDEGELILEHYNPKYCYPELNPDGDLESLRIQYVYEDKEDTDERGKPREKWYRLDLGKDVDRLYDNPPYKPDAEPTFNVVNEVAHELGFVQGEWIRTTEEKHIPDGENLILPITGFIDALNYNLSQTDRAVSYGLDPQLVISNMDEDELDKLIKSAVKAWNVGREGDAKFIEVQGSGVERAEETRLSFTKNLGEFTRVIMLDPEKMVTHAQSGKAMEVLMGPLLELIDELRPQMGKGIVRLLQKMMTALTIFNQRGEEMSIVMPKGYTPTSLDIELTWPKIFPLTIQDMQGMAGVVTQLGSNNIVSRETLFKWLISQGFDFGVEDIDEEIRRINTQQQFNTFGF